MAAKRRGRGKSNGHSAPVMFQQIAWYRCDTAAFNMFFLHVGMINGHRGRRRRWRKRHSGGGADDPPYRHLEIRCCMCVHTSQHAYVFISMNTSKHAYIHTSMNTPQVTVKGMYRSTGIHRPGRVEDETTPFTMSLTRHSRHVFFHYSSNRNRC